MAEHHRPTSRPPASWRHGELMLKVGMILAQYARENARWSVAVGDPGTKLRHDPDVLRGPDVAVIRAERRPTDVLEGGEALPGFRCEAEALFE